MYTCFNCKTPWESSLRQPAVKETCTRCGAYLHCCRNCRFHRKGYPNECYIPDTEKIADKARANFCDEFEFRPVKATSDAPTSRDQHNRLWESDGEVGSPSREDSAAIKDWFSESDNTSKGFEDLFED